MIYQYTNQKLIGYKFKNHTLLANEQQIDFFFFEIQIYVPVDGILIWRFQSVKKLSVKSLILTISLSISSDTLWRDNSEFFKLHLLRKFKKYLIKEQDISHGCGQYAMWTKNIDHNWVVL